MRRRLELALEHGVPDEMRLETEDTLAAVKLVLSQGQPEVRYAPDFLFHLPTGSLAELQAIIDDEGQALWNRGKAAIAIGKKLEADGQVNQATAAYEHALELLRKVYPYYSGVSSRLGAQQSSGGSATGEECQLVADLYADLNRLSQDKYPPLAGGIEIALEGVTLPPEVVMGIQLELSDPAVANPDQNLPQHLPRLVRLDSDGRAFVGVLNGNYHVAFRGQQARWSSSREKFMRLLQLDTDHWPTEVTLSDNRLRLPPVRLRLAEEIRPLSPEQGASLKLKDAEFRWRAVPQAAYYQIRFCFSTESPNPTSTYFSFIRTQETHLRLDSLEAVDRKAIATNLQVGRTGGWTVTAYDVQDRCIGVSLEERRFLVAQELSPE